MQARKIAVAVLAAVVIVPAAVALMLGRARTAEPIDAGAPASADGWTEPAGVGKVLVQSVGPLLGGGFFVVGAHESGKAWLLRVDSKGDTKQNLFESGYLADALSLSGGRLAVAGYRDDQTAFVGKVDPVGTMSDVAVFSGDPGSEISAVAADGARVFGAGLENTPRLGHSAGWLIAGGDSTHWSDETTGSAYVYTTGIAVAGGTVFWCGGGSAGSAVGSRPWRRARLVDGGAVSQTDETRSPAREGQYGAVVALDDGVAFVGTATFDEKESYPRLFVETYAPGGAPLRSRVRVGEDVAYPDMIGRAIATRDGIAFTTAWGPDHSSHGALIVVAKDGRSSSTPLPGPGKVSMRKSAHWIVGLQDREATIVRVRTEPTFGYRVDRLTTAPLAATAAVIDAGADGAKAL